MHTQLDFSLTLAALDYWSGLYFSIVAQFFLSNPDFTIAGVG